jgi:hypothetical protein
MAGKSAVGYDEDGWYCRHRDISAGQLTDQVHTKPDSLAMEMLVSG